MLRLIFQPVLAVLLWILAVAPLAEPIGETLVVDRDGVQFDLRGGCTNHHGSGLWLFVRVQHSDKSADTLELWFVDVSAERLNRVQVVSEIPIPPGRSVGCAAGDGRSFAWRLVDRGNLHLQGISRDGLERIPVELPGHWEYPVKAVRLDQQILTFVANDAVGIFDLNAETLARHERWTVAAWIEPGTGDLYSVRSMEAIDEDADGFPPVALTREAVLPDGSLRLLASTDSWPAMQQVEDGPIEEIGYINYSLAATRDEVLLLREHFFGTGRLRVTVRDKATLRDTRTFAVDMRPSVGGVMDTASVAGQAVAAVPKYSDGSESVRLLHIDPSGRVREFTAPPVHDGPLTILDFELFDVGQFIYAVATQSINKPYGKARPLTIDVFGVQYAP